jgi:uncharacterized protein (TIGR02266 family)
MINRENRISPRAKINWPVMVQKPTGVMEGVTLNVSSSGLFIGCRKPLRLNEVFGMVISSPDQQIGAQAEVVWSNIYGPDDEISPRGMGVRFLDLSDEDRQFIAEAVEKHNAQDNNLKI